MLKNDNRSDQLQQQMWKRPVGVYPDIAPTNNTPQVAKNHGSKLCIDKLPNKELPVVSVALEALCLNHAKLIDFAYSGQLTLTPTGTIAEINNVGAKLLKVERKNLIQRHFMQFIASEYKDLWHMVYLLWLNQGRMPACELLMRCEDGDTFYATIECQYGDEQKVPEVLAIKFTDIIKKKQAEEKLRAAFEDFESQQAIIVTDPDNHILHTNQAFTRITGYNHQEVIGKSPAILRSDLYSNNFYQIRWVEVVSDNFWQGEIGYENTKGGVFPSLEIVTELGNADGKIVIYVVCMAENSSINKTEIALLDAYQRQYNQLATTNEELETLKKEYTQVSEVLNFMVKRQDKEKSEANVELLNQVELTVLPSLSQLKQSLVDRSHRNLLNIIEKNLIDILHGNGNITDFSASYNRLTRIESLVATMVKQGHPTKTIAKNLSISPETVKIHRKQIRKKFGLVNKAQSLYSYLILLSE